MPQMIKISPVKVYIFVKQQELLYEKCEPSKVIFCQICQNSEEQVFGIAPLDDFFCACNTTCVMFYMTVTLLVVFHRKKVYRRTVKSNVEQNVS